LNGNLLDQLTPQECYECEYLSNEFSGYYNPRARKCWEERVAEHLSHQHRSQSDKIERRNPAAVAPEAPEVVQHAETLDSVVSRITPANLHEETHWGSPVGKELW
jgi:hypothetical protein